MAYVSEQSTDSVTQSNVSALGSASSFAMGALYQALSHSTSIMYENEVNSQNQQNILAQAVTSQGVVQIYSIDTVSDAIAIAKMLNASV